MEDLLELYGEFSGQLLDLMIRQPIVGSVWLAGAIFVGAVGRALGRSPWAWFLLSLAFSPLAGLLCLVFGSISSGSARKQEGATAPGSEEELSREDVGESEPFNQECPYCHAALNVLTGEGLQNAEGEPWVVSCEACKEVLPEGFLQDL